MSTPVLLILGAGPGIGNSVASSFAAKGYKIALAARSLDDGLGSDGFLRLRVDLSYPEEIQGAFAKVKEQLGVPTAVVYNASIRIVRDAQDPLSSLSIDEVNHEFALNVISPLIAAKEAVNGFKQVSNSASRTFIWTGNILNHVVKTDVLTYGMTRVAAANMIQTSALAYSERGFKFYYADERQADGGPTIPPTASAAGTVYSEIAEKAEQGPWNYTFVNGKGYTEFKDLVWPRPEDYTGH